MSISFKSPMKLLTSKKKDSGPNANDNILEDRKFILNPQSDFFIREAYKTLRTNIMFSLTGDENCKIIAVTSSSQGEGKSLTALNLSISLAEADKRVLIIDCDLRRPKLVRLLNIKAKSGLSNVLIDPSLLPSSIFKQKDVKNLSVLASGSIPPNPSELLGSARMEKLLTVMREQFDYIVFDTPPVNMVTDAAVIARISDGMLFVVRAGRTDADQVSHALDQLEYAKANVLGFVLNGVDFEKTHYGYKKYGGYGYRRYKRYGYSRYGYETHSSRESGEGDNS